MKTAQLAGVCRGPNPHSNRCGLAVEWIKKGAKEREQVEQKQSQLKGRKQPVMVARGRQTQADL